MSDGKFLKYICRPRRLGRVTVYRHIPKKYPKSIFGCRSVTIWWCIDSRRISDKRLILNFENIGKLVRPRVFVWPIKQPNQRYISGDLFEDPKALTTSIYLPYPPKSCWQVSLKHFIYSLATSSLHDNMITQQKKCQRCTAEEIKYRRDKAERCWLNNNLGWSGVLFLFGCVLL